MTPIQDAFDAILALMQIAQKHEAFSDETHRKYMDIARGLLDSISRERHENSGE